MLTKIVLYAGGVSFLVYGLMCLVAPNLPAEYSGMELPNASALTEVTAMYGGLQIAIGVLFLYSVRQPELHFTGLLATAILLGGLASGRFIGIAMNGMTPYNAGAIVFELGLTVSAVIALSRSRSNQPAGA